MDEDEKDWLYNTKNSEKYEEDSYEENDETNNGFFHEYSFSIIIIFIVIAIGAFLGFRLVMNSLSSNTVSNNSSQNINLIESVDEEVICDKAGLKISTTGDFEETNSKITIDLLLENPGVSTKTYQFAVGALNHNMAYGSYMSVNDVTIYSKKKAIATLVVDKRRFKKSGSELSQISIAFTNGSVIYSGNINLNNSNTHLDKDEIDSELYNGNNVILQQLGLSDDNPTFVIYNLSDTDIKCYAWNVSINDFTYDLKEWKNSDISGLFSNELVLSDCFYKFSIPVDSQFKQANHIDEIETVEFEFETNYGKSIHKTIRAEY